eukprot:79649_1
MASCCAHSNNTKYGSLPTISNPHLLELVDKIPMQCVSDYKQLVGKIFNIGFYGVTWMMDQMSKQKEYNEVNPTNYRFNNVSDINTINLVSFMEQTGRHMKQTIQTI